MHHRRCDPNKIATDEYYTPTKVWDDIKQYISSDKVIFEAFYGEGHTFNYFKDNGYNVIGKKGLDFFSDEGMSMLKKCDCVISNPPYSKKYKILKTLVENDVPFILTMPLSAINTLAFLNAFDNKMDDVSIIMPRGRIKYIYKGSIANSPSFESCYVSYKMLKEKLIFLCV